MSVKTAKKLEMQYLVDKYKSRNPIQFKDGPTKPLTFVIALFKENQQLD